MATKGLAIGIAAVVKRFDCRVGNDLPPLVLMAAGLARFDGQASVEQHDALIRPRRQIAVRGHGYAEVIRQLLVYIGQTTRNGLDIGRHAEAQSHRMTGGWVGVLAHDKHLDAVEWDGEGAQNVRAGGKIPASGCDFASKEIAHAVHLWLDLGEGIRPSGLHEIFQRLDVRLCHAPYCTTCCGPDDRGGLVFTGWFHERSE